MIHRVVVARGAGEACRRHFGGQTGSLRIRPEISGDQHCSADALPFVIGDLEPDGSFVHVMDEVTLDIVLRELDTILDFTDYLRKKATFIRSGLLRTALGEQDLLAHYAIRVNGDGEHDFVEDGRGTAALDIRSGEYDRFVRDLRYLARRDANRPSYVWDGLIETFTSHMIEGTTELLDGYDYDVRLNEIGVRRMALQRRTVRRMLGTRVADARERGAHVPVFFRRMITSAASPASASEATGFFVLTMKHQGSGEYADYRRMRANAAIICAKGVLLKHTDLARVVGVSCEPAGEVNGSEDLVYAEQADWSDEDRAAIKEDCRRLGVMQPGQTERRWRQEEFPEP